MSSYPRSPFSLGRIGVLVVCVAVSCGAVVGSGALTEPQWALLASIACSVFPVLFGFSVTAMTIAGAMDSTITILSWESLQMYQRTFEAKLLRQCLLGLACFASIVLGALLHVTPFSSPAFFWLSRGFAFCGAFTLVVALTIPLALFSLYSEKYACIVEELRSKAVTKFRNEE